MKKITESLAEFYLHKHITLPEDRAVQVSHFSVFRIEDWIHDGSMPPTYVRREFYKIMLLQGDNIFHYGDTSTVVEGNTLLFFNPQVPYKSEPLTAQTKGYFCVFKDEFFQSNLRLNLKELSVFMPGNQSVFALNDDQLQEARTIFEKIIGEFDSDFIYKFELIKNYVSELIYTAIKLQPSGQILQYPDASTRVTGLFSELLEGQFPIVSNSERFDLRSPKIIAEKLSVHVNHLNRSVKKTTGRTTTEHIADRLISEAKALLRHTNWNIAEISYVLGFEDQAQFTKFFKKNTKINPSSLRRV